ncbi:mechanosensitive ion channel family protein [Haloarchaeobius baliensis]|uniref:mechanosensitive ion channel family protein n=1 Tax=Haloarchaeobius baliensis TaxID=1670458 RepID=UPI003F884582
MSFDSPWATYPVLQIDTFVEEISALEGGFVRGFTVFLIGLVVVYFLARFVVVRRLTRWMTAHGVDSSIVSMARLAGQIGSAALAFGIATSVAGFGSITTALSAVTGAIAIAVGLAANDIIGNLLAGLYIINEDLFEVGDWIEWDDQRGRVEQIDLRITRLRTFDNEQIAVPNSTLANTTVTNPEAFGRLRISVQFDVSPADIDRTIEIIEDEARAFPEIMAEPAPSVRIAELGDTFVGLRARVWMSKPSRSDFNRLRTAYVRNVLGRLVEEGIDVDPSPVSVSGQLEVS